MNTTESGRKAEKAARVYLEMRGYKVLEQNWRRPNCEIDIVAAKNNVIHFVEVKYRKSEDQGGGYGSITATKLKQMQRSAWTYIEEYEWRGEYVLSAVEVGGREYAIMGFIDNVF
ncbi:MAG: YraN family protein [Patescibacteria group bacterium]|nr:YraN family protein [Patescibacteria group bacterium]